jgi:hypothetical protein
MDHAVGAAARNDDMRSSSQTRHALLPQQHSQQHGKVIRLFHLRYLGSPWRAGLRSAAAPGLLARLEHNGLGAGGVCSVDGPGVWAAQAPAAREGISGDVCVVRRQALRAAGLVDTVCAAGPSACQSSVSSTLLEFETTSCTREKCTICAGRCKTGCRSALCGVRLGCICPCFTLAAC